MDDDSSRDQIRFERDLYRSILDLSATDELDPFLDKALDLIMSITGCKRGILGLGRPEDEQSMPTEWWRHRGAEAESELEGLQRRVSSSIVRTALEEGRVVETRSAFLDPRFEWKESVRSQQIESVLCVPIGDRVGVVYLEGHQRLGPFGKEEVQNVELFAREVGRIAPRLLAARRTAKNLDDPTQQYRQRMRLDEVIGRSKALAHVLGDIEISARSQASVLITGESGTGKSAIARIIHNHGRRANEAFVPINCAAVPEGLIESELFGNVEGAFTNARPNPGRISAAEGGTLFLDEVAELSLRAQAKLLQFLNDKTYCPLGSNELRTADVRIISATNVDLAKAKEEGRFRADLFFRLQVLTLRVPSLRERRTDIPLLLEHFAEVKANENHVPVPQMTPSAYEAAEIADWPGNVRELAGAIERAVIKAAQKGLDEVDGALLLDRMTGSIPPAAVSEPSALHPYPDSLHLAKRQFVKEHLELVLEKVEYNYTRAAERLDIARSYLYRLMNDLGLERRP